MDGLVLTTLYVAKYKGLIDVLTALPARLAAGESTSESFHWRLANCDHVISMALLLSRPRFVSLHSHSDERRTHD